MTEINKKFWAIVGMLGGNILAWLIHPIPGLIMTAIVCAWAGGGGLDEVGREEHAPNEPETGEKEEDQLIKM